MEVGGELVAAIILAREGVFVYGGDLFMYGTDFKLSIFIHGILSNLSLILVVPSRS